MKQTTVFTPEQGLVIAEKAIEAARGYLKKSASHESIKAADDVLGHALRQIKKVESDRAELVNILKHLLNRPDFLEDKEYRRQIEEAIK